MQRLFAGPIHGRGRLIPCNTILKWNLLLRFRLFFREIISSGYMLLMRPGTFPRWTFPTNRRINSMKHFLPILAFMTLFNSCTKQLKHEQDLTKPVIKVDYPTDRPKINGGDPLCMKVLISDNKSLASVWLEVNDGNGFKKEYFIPGRSLDIIEKYTAPTAVNGHLIATFFATDEAGNITSEKIEFRVNN
jgi:hypothetical protein